MSQDEIMTREEAEELATQIRREVPEMDVSVHPHIPPYEGYFYVRVYPCGPVVVRTSQQWRDRKGDILRLREAK